MGHSKLLPNLAQIARDAALVLHHRTAADHFQIGDLCQIGENFVLHSVGEEFVLFFLAQILKRQDRDAFVGHAQGRVRRFARNEEEGNHNRGNYE